jgi:molecular chaperone GrpE (heat shock protein)
MTIEPSGKPDLRAMTGPPTAPSDKPDLLTTQEEKQAKKAAAKLTPTEQTVAAKNQHLEEACGKRDRLEEDNRRLQSELDRLRPDHARLEEELSHSRSASDISFLLLTVGALLVSGASYHDSKTQILWLGYGFFMAGVFAYAWNKLVK